MSIINQDKQFVANTYNRFPVEIVSGKNEICYDEKGKEYIDLTSGIGVNSFGFAEEKWVEATTKQLQTLQHTSNLYYTQPCAELAKLLCEKTGFKKVFFSNSGAEANEGAIKYARKYSQDKYGLFRHTIITLNKSFHGRTLTTLQATGQDVFHKNFNPLTQGFEHINAENLEELNALYNRDDICGIMLELVQGEGGVIALSKEYVLAVQEYCNKKDIVFIVDEVQTGNGRVGELYAFMHYGIKPDVVTTAKGLGNGLPIGAVMVGEKVENVLGFGDHATTFGANPVCCAGAISVISRMDKDFLQQVKEKAQLVREMLNGAKGVESVSGLGLMIGIKTTRPARDILLECIQNGVLCLTAKDKVRLLPPLNIKKENLIKAIKVIIDACGKEI